MYILAEVHTIDIAAHHVPSWAALPSAGRVAVASSGDAASCRFSGFRCVRIQFRQDDVQPSTDGGDQILENVTLES